MEIREVETRRGIVAFAFGVPDTIRSNRSIAFVATFKARQLNAPIYTQADVKIFDPSVLVFHTPEEPNSPPPTLRIARGAVSWAKHPDNRLTELWVVAAKPHLWRAERDLRQAVREAGGGIIVRICEEIKQYPERDWFCSDSTQERTQSQKAWDGRERVLKVMPFFIYKRVAS